MTKLNVRSFIQLSGALALAGLAANATAAIFELQHGALPDASYEYQHTLIRNDTFLADTPQFDNDLLVGTKADTGPGDQGELRSILQFDLSPVAAGIGSTPISGVSLQLMHLPTTGGLPRIDGTPKVDVYAYDFDFTQELATWNDPDGDGSPATGDTTPGGTLGAFIGTFGELAAANGIFDPTMESTPAFIAAVEDALAGDQFLRLILVEDAPDVSTRDIAFFLGSSNRSPETLPKITITTSDSGGLVGDYNEDGFVDAADYTAWRDRLGAAIALPNEEPSTTPGEVTAEDIEVWKTHFGTSLAAGALQSSIAVPEPSSVVLLACIWASALLVGHSRRIKVD